MKGLEPELERMAAAHQEELAELRRVHQRQLTEMEAAWVRRTAALRENEALERQVAIQHEREASRHRWVVAFRKCKQWLYCHAHG